MLTLTVPGKKTAVEQTLAALLKQHALTVLYFYPKDDTPGCTTEALEFSALYDAFAQLNVGVYGGSKDTATSHCTFQAKYTLTIPLLSDDELILHKQFGARGSKTNFGKTSMGTIRSTVILDPSASVIHQRRSVKAVGHAATVLARLHTRLSKK